MPAKKKRRQYKRSKTFELTKIHLVCVTILILLLSFLNILTMYSPRKTITVYAKDQTPLIQVYYLKNLLTTHPTYREGWVALAKLEYSLGNKKEMQIAIKKVQDIDPNYKGLIELQQLTLK